MLHTTLVLERFQRMVQWYRLRGNLPRARYLFSLQGHFLLPEKITREMPGRWLFSKQRFTTKTVPETVFLTILDKVWRVRHYEDGAQARVMPVIVHFVRETATTALSSTAVNCLYLIFPSLYVLYNGTRSVRLCSI